MLPTDPQMVKGAYLWTQQQHKHVLLHILLGKPHPTCAYFSWLRGIGSYQHVRTEKEKKKIKLLTTAATVESIDIHSGEKQSNSPPPHTHTHTHTHTHARTHTHTKKEAHVTSSYSQSRIALVTPSLSSLNVSFYAITLAYSSIHVSDLPHDCTHTHSDRERERVSERERRAEVEFHPHAHRKQKKKKKQAEEEEQEQDGGRLDQQRGMDRFLRGGKADGGKGWREGWLLWGTTVLLLFPSLSPSFCLPPLSLCYPLLSASFFVPPVIIPSSIIAVSNQHFPLTFSLAVVKKKKSPLHSLFTACVSRGISCNTTALISLQLSQTDGSSTQWYDGDMLLYLCKGSHTVHRTYFIKENNISKKQNSGGTAYKMFVLSHNTVPKFVRN